MGASHEALLAAKAAIERDFLSRGADHSKPHTVYLGERRVAGVETGEPAVVCVVAEKLPAAQISARGWNPIPAAWRLDGETVPIDVIESPPPEYALAFLPDWRSTASNDWQRCHDCPLPGGVQIAPHEAQWVGTLGCAFSFLRADGSRAYGALTNYHVAHGGKFPVGTRLLQPHGQSNPELYFGRLAMWSPIRFESRGSAPENRVDAALIDCRRSDGPYAPATDTVRSEQLRIGTLVPQPHTAQRVGDPVVKSGRTTYLTQGTIVGVEATSYVDYGPEGAAKFVRQLVIESPAGNFSAGGDSGSLILTPDRRPTALLFAGGGRQTIANPIQFVLDAFPGSQFWSN